MNMQMWFIDVEVSYNMEKIETKKYFQNKLDSERKRIDRFECALNDLETSNIKGIRIGQIHLANLYLNCIKLTYSKEKSFHKMFPDYMKFLEYYKAVCTPNDSMYDIVDVLSIGVLLEDRKKEFIGYLDEILLKYESNDGIITFLMDYLKDRTLQRTISKIDYFNVLLISEDKVKILKKELELWYDKHSDAYWYNSHKSKDSTYCGYWCFEIAALAQIFGLDDTSLRENQYYPYEIE